MDLGTRAGCFDARHAHSERFADLREQGHGARAPSAESEVVTDHDMAGADPCCHHIRNEGCRLASGEGAIEPRDIENLDTEAGKMTGLDPEGREPEGLVRSGEHLARVWFEGEHGEWRLKSAGDAPAFLDNGAVTQMDAVEITDGDHRAPRICGC